MSEGWLESKVGGGGGNIDDEGYLDRSTLIDSLLAKMEFHANNISALCSKIVGGGTKSEQDCGLNKSTEII